MLLSFELPPEATVLVAGAGGGYDVVCALPLALALRREGHRVHLASNSSSPLSEVAQATDNLYAVTPDTPLPRSGYLPEAQLARWWHEALNEPVTIWCYRKLGVRPLEEAFARLAADLELDAIVVCDAGVDGLFHGNEHDLGTPTTDAISILAAYKQRALRRYYVFTAFGTEGRNHEVRHCDALLRVAQLIPSGGLLGVSALLPQQPEGKQFLAALDSIHRNTAPHWHSNMASSLAAALRGLFGHQELTVKNTEAPIWVSPLTLLYWFFDLDQVAEAKPYLQEVLDTETPDQVRTAIEATRRRLGVLPRLDMPI